MTDDFRPTNTQRLFFILNFPAVRLKDIFHFTKLDFCSCWTLVYWLVDSPAMSLEIIVGLTIAGICMKR